MFSREERVRIFISRFAGRIDVFARRWEKWNGGGSGYAPLYTDPDKKTYLLLTSDWIEKHLIGTATLGTYPLRKEPCALGAGFFTSCTYVHRCRAWIRTKITTSRASRATVALPGSDGNKQYIYYYKTACAAKLSNWAGQDYDVLRVASYH